MSEDKAHGHASVNQTAHGPETLSSTQLVQEANPRDIPTARTELLTRARAFLTSPQIRLQDSDAKRDFLAEKGLTMSEVDQLLRELPPPVPPRAYPTPPPSNLPNIFIGIARIFTWLTGTSAFVLFIYYWYLLPRLTQSYQARLVLRKHQFALIARLTESASALKATQAESFKDLPRPIPVYEDSRYIDCHTIDDLLTRTGSSEAGSSGSAEDIPDVTILRCGLEELSQTKEGGSDTSTEELFQYLERKLAWLSGEGGAARQSKLWIQLSTCPLFISSMPKSGASSPFPPDHLSRLLWKYTPPTLSPTPLVLTSLANLQAALPRNFKPPVTDSKSSTPAVPTLSAAQRTLQVLSEFTGYITTQTYSLGTSPIRGVNGVAPSGYPVEDELRREIRALKGLVLNRRSFLPPGAGVARPMSDPPPATES
ncbi:hypothetical protein BS17DRAFT_775967 [Gyrodon lividus]|nr:hypothetical protein BS17DRAFT_775967 [Gyrodon lividus]